MMQPCLCNDRLRYPTWWIGICFLSFFAGSLKAAPGFSCEDATADTCRSLVLSVRINGSIPSGNSEEGIFLFEESGRIFVNRTDLTRWQFRIPRETAFVRDGAPWIALDGCTGIRYRIRTDTQELLIDAPPESFQENSMSVGRDGRSPIERGVGAFLNYDLGLEYSGGTGFNGMFDANIFGRWGIVNSKFFRRGFDQSGLVRLETTLIHDLPERLQTIRIGDSTTAAGSWGRSVYFGGVQWSTDFGTQPDMVTFPLPSIRGEALVPSTADLYINNILRWSQNVTPGPFEIRNPPLVSGPGQLTLVVHDLMGRQTMISQPYFSTPRLLRPGLIDFSLSLGKIRTGFGSALDGYGRAFASGMYRRGLTNRVTVEARGDTAGGVSTVGGTVTAVLWGPVLGTAGWAASRGNSLHGQMVLAGLEFQSRRFSAGFQSQRGTRGFRQLGLDTDRLPPRRQDSVFLSMSLFRRDNLTASYFKQEGDLSIGYTSITLSINLGHRLYWSASMNTSTVGTQRNLFTTGLIFQLSERISVAPSVRRYGGQTEAQVQVQRNRTFGPGLGYRMLATSGENARVEGDLSVGTQHQDIQVAASQTPWGTAFRTSLQGAVGWTRKKLFISRRIQDSFAVVKVGEFPGISVMVDNQPIAVTDRNGLAVIPRLLSYQENRISIDPSALPIHAAIGQTDMKIRPARRSGVGMDFPIRVDDGVLVRFEDENSQPLPLGATVSVEGANESFVIGNDGLAYLTGVRGKVARVTIRWPGNECQAKLPRTEGSEETVQCIGR